MSDIEARTRQWRAKLAVRADALWGADRSGAIEPELQSLARSLAMIETASLEPSDPAPSVIAAAAESSRGLGGR